MGPHVSFQDHLKGRKGLLEEGGVLIANHKSDHSYRNSEEGFLLFCSV